MYICTMQAQLAKQQTIELQKGSFGSDTYHVMPEQ